MNNIIIIIMFLFVSETFCQNEIRKFYYADTAVMINLENDFWVIDKEKLNKTKYTGHICFFYDSLKQDTAIYAEVKKGKLEGKYKKWEKNKTYLTEEAEYKNGLRNGVSSRYLRIYPMANNMAETDSFYVESYNYLYKSVMKREKLRKEWISGYYVKKKFSK